MSIHQNHLNDLEASGLNCEQIAAAQIYTEVDPKKIAELLNWEHTANKLGSCCVFPYLAADGQPTGYHRLKPSSPRTQSKNEKTRTVKYEAPLGLPNRAYFPPNTLTTLADPTSRLLITEGEKKALKADQEGFPTIGLSGVWAWQQKRERDPDENAIGDRQFIPDLEGIQWQEREVVIVFDSDSATNPNVRMAEDKLLECLKGNNAQVAILRLPSGPNETKCGLDDFLLWKNREQLQAMIDDVIEVSKLSEFSVMCERIDKHVNSGGTGVFLDDALLEAIAKLSIHDQRKYSAVRAHMKSQKIGLRDVEKAISGFRDEILKKIPPVMARDDTGGYFIEEGKFCRGKETLSGRQIITLCNFTASIIGEITMDDGIEKRLFFEIEGELGQKRNHEGGLIPGRKLPKILVPATEFGKMNWVTEAWGSEATIYANELCHMVPAIKCLSDHSRKKREKVCTHTGWIEDGPRSVYLHSGGVIGSSSSTSSLSVALDGPLKNFNIRPLSESVTIKEGLTRVLSFLTKSDETDDNNESGITHLTYILLATVFRSVIKSSDFGLHLCGPTGVFKSELAALMQQFYGSGLDSRHLPGSWSSTANANESLAFLAKDALLVIDDFAPTSSDNSRLHRDADRLFRNQGNNAGRGRSRVDGTRLPERPPRGLIVSTGEDIPKGHSLRARALILEISPGEVSKDWLSECQRDAEAGIYCGVMHEFIRCLSSLRNGLIANWGKNVGPIRDEFISNGLHARTPGIAAELLYGFQIFTNFASHKEAIDDERREELNAKCREALLVISKQQLDHQSQSDPTQTFIKLLGAILSSGRAHLVTADGERPDHAAEYGWQKTIYSNSGSDEEQWSPKGLQIGWIDSNGIYLEPESAFAEVQKLSREQGDSIPVTPTTLWKRLKEKGFIASSYDQRNKIQKKLSGSRRYVIHLQPDVLGVEKMETASIFNWD